MKAAITLGRSALLAALFLATTTPITSRAAASDFEGKYSGKWTSSAFDGQHTGNMDVTIKSGKKNAMRMVAVSEIFGKTFKFVLRSQPSGKATLSVTNSNLRKNNGAAINGTGRFKAGNRKATADLSGTLFTQTTTGDVVITKTRNGITAKGSVSVPGFTYFDFTFTGRQK